MQRVLVKKQQDKSMNVLKNKVFNKNSYFVHVPCDIVFSLVSFLPVSSLCSVQKTCSHFYFQKSIFDSLQKVLLHKSSLYFSSFFIEKSTPLQIISSFQSSLTHPQFNDAHVFFLKIENGDIQSIQFFLNIKRPYHFEHTLHIMSGLVVSKFAKQKKITMLLEAFLQVWINSVPSKEKERKKIKNKFTKEFSVLLNLKISETSPQNSLVPALKEAFLSPVYPLILKSIQEI